MGNDTWPGLVLNLFKHSSCSGHRNGELPRTILTNSNNKPETTIEIRDVRQSGWNNSAAAAGPSGCESRVQPHDIYETVSVYIVIMRVPHDLDARRERDADRGRLLSGDCLTLAAIVQVSKWLSWLTTSLKCWPIQWAVKASVCKLCYYHCRCRRENLIISLLF